MRTRRIVIVTAAVALAVAGFAGPAAAHVELTADKDTAGATDVMLTFTGEAENPKAGIRSERVVLPDGIAPGSVTAVKLPPGWTFTADPDGFTVGGRPLKTGTDAVWSVRVAKLPDSATRLSFKTLETYGDGDVARWIEIQEAGQAEPDNPAPLLVLKPGPSAAPTTAAPTTPAPTTPAATAPAAAPTTAPAAAPAADRGTGSTWWIWVLVVAVLLIIAAVVVRRRDRSRGDGPPGQD